jgi:hypothetical protein
MSTASPSATHTHCPKPCSLACEPASRAAQLPPTLRVKKGGYASLMALLVPGIAFALGLWVMRTDPRLPWLTQPSTWPWELWTITLAGVIATLGGLGDWGFHRWVAKCQIGRAERNCELLALAAGGVPLFVMMASASMSARPLQWLLPVIVIVLFITTLICYDEFVYHRRRCKGLETLLHRLLVFGNGTAWLAWSHWTFVRGGLTSYGQGQ